MVSPGARGATPAPPHALPATPSGVVLDGAMGELSGIAASSLRPDLLWAVNDNDNDASLFALTTGGRRLARYVVEGATNVDWEDLAPFRRDGRSYLLIADVGNNNGSRDELELLVVPEPVPDGAETGIVSPAWRVRFRYPDGPRDCEAVAVDALRAEVLLLSKRRQPAQLFRVPLKPADPAQTQVASEIARATNIPQPGADTLARHPVMGRYFGQPTGMALAPDGAELAVLTYGDLYLYARAPGAGWQQAFDQPPRAVGMPVLPQAEAVTYAADGSVLYVTGERLPAPILRVGRSVR